MAATFFPSAVSVALLVVVLFPHLLWTILVAFSGTFVVTILIYELMQEAAVLAVALLALQELATIPCRPEACSQDVAIYGKAIHGLNRHVRILGLFEGQVRAEDRRAVVGIVPSELCLHWHLANRHTRQLPVLPEELWPPQHLRLGYVCRQADDVHYIPLQDTHLAEVSASTTALLFSLFELLRMPCPQIPLLLLTRLFVGLVMSALVLVFLASLPLVGNFLAARLRSTSVVSKTCFSVVLSTCRALAVHLLHNVVDAEQANLVVARTCEKRLVRLVQGLHA
mmetsp:Transcript_120427/g.300426  ORF Transcript_120427/g.300426 Transcript_120427/m.300426 type:complete len:282 (+) Transcript_120427:633-1478(+)